MIKILKETEVLKEALETLKEGNPIGDLIYQSNHSFVYQYKNLYIKIFTISEKKCSLQECEILEKIQGESFAPVLIAYDPQRFHITEEVKGVELNKFVRERNFYPIELFQLVYSAFNRLLDLGIEYADHKNEHILITNQAPIQIKLLDYGVCTIYEREDIINFAKEGLKEEYGFLFGEDSFEDLEQDLLCEGFSKHIIQDCIDKLKQLT